MKRASSLLISTALLVISSLAQAQTAAEAPAPPAPAVPEAIPQAAVSCGLGEVVGFPEDQTRVWQTLLCDELAKQGRRATPGSGGQEVFRLDMMRLEKKIVARLTHEKPAGTWVASERAVLSDGDELLTALPRLVSAVNSGESFEQTGNVKNLTHQETRPTLKRSGDLLVGGSLFGMAFPGMPDAKVATGLGLSLVYETPSLAAVADLRFTIGGDDSYGSAPKETSGSWVSLSMGGRYFLSDSDIAPFLGGGLGVHWASYKDSSVTSKALNYWGDSTHKTNSVGLYGEAGLELLRTHRSRLILGIRLDLPATSATGDPFTDSSWSPDGQPTHQKILTPERRYVAPLSFGATYYFH